MTILSKALEAAFNLGVIANIIYLRRWVLCIGVGSLILVITAMQK